MASEEPRDGRETALVPLEQRHIEIEGEDVLAAWTGQHDVYVPLTPIYEALGIAPAAQVRRIRRDDVLAEQLRFLRINTPDGPQTVQALHLEAVPMWLATLDTARVKEEVRPRLRAFKLWVRQKVWEAFAAEMGWSQATGVAPAPADPSLLSLEQVAEFGRALTTLAEQQISYQRAQARAMIEVRGTLSDHEQRLVTQEGRPDKADQVMGATIREVRALKKRLGPGATITDEQAAELSTRVKVIAEELTRQAAGTPHQKNYYASLFGELHRRFPRRSAPPCVSHALGDYHDGEVAAARPRALRAFDASSAYAVALSLLIVDLHIYAGRGVRVAQRKWRRHRRTGRVGDVS